MKSGRAFASDVLQALDRENPDAVALARFLSLAAIVDAPLLRSARLRHLPRSHASLEAELWFGPLVTQRSVDGFVLDDDAVALLRGELLRRGLVDPAWELVRARHGRVHPAVALEEELTWRALKGAPAEELDRLLARALRTMLEPGRAGVMAWAARAIPRLPAPVQRTRTAPRLLAISQLLIADEASRRREPSRDGDLDWMSWIRLEEGQVVPIYVAYRASGVLEIGLDELEGGRRIEVTRSSPLAAEVRHIANEGVRVHLLVLGRDRVVRLPERAQAFRVRFADGQTLAVGDENHLPSTDRETSGSARLAEWRRRLRPQEWEEAFAKLQVGSVLTANLAYAVRGGYVVDIGVPAFLPQSQAYSGPAVSESELREAPLDVEIILLDPPARRIVVSRRAVIESANRAERLEARRRFVESVQVGDTMTGVVRSVHGVLVTVDFRKDVDGVGYAVDAERHFVPGSEVVVSVARVDSEHARLVVRFPAVQDEPWRAFVERRKIGEDVEAVVANVVGFGVFFAIDGVLGLLPRTIMSPEDAARFDRGEFVVGELVRGQIKQIDERDRRVVLGRGTSRAVADARAGKTGSRPSADELERVWSALPSSVDVGLEVTARVTNLCGFGAFLALDGGPVALLHLNEMPWSRGRVPGAQTIGVGDVLRARVLKLDRVARRMALTVLDTSTATHRRATVTEGAQLEGFVRRIGPFGAFVEVEDGVDGLLRLSIKAARRISAGTRVRVVVESVRTARDQILLRMPKATSSTPDAQEPV